MKLLAILKQALKESDVYDLHGGNPNLIEFPKDNMVASLMPKEKRIELSPRDDQKKSTRIRSMIGDLKQQFKIANVVQLGMNTFNIILDPIENFDKVAAYVRDFA